MSQIVTLSGWTQPADAISKALNINAEAFDYSHYASPEQMFEALKSHRETPHIIAWSLGGQLVMRAIAEGVLAPSYVTLIATPYQFVSDASFKSGMDPLTFQQFRANYAQNAARSKERFKALIAKGDSKFRDVMEATRHHEAVEDTARWLPWLDDLGNYSHAASNAQYSGMKIQIIHGMEDAITPVAQTEAWHRHHPEIGIYRWQGAAHAPHLHDADRLRNHLHEHHRALLT